MMNIEISVGSDFGDLSLTMQKALTFMFTRHLVSLAHGDEGELRITVPHPDHPKQALDHDYTRALGGGRNINALIRAGLVKRRLRGKACSLVLTAEAFGLATSLMNAVHHSLLHAAACVRESA
jgi:hypothetical protein